MLRFQTFILLSILLSACQTEPISELLTVEAPETLNLAVGERITIRGQGFVAGSTANVRLYGEIHRPGSSPEPFDASLEGMAISEEEVEFTVPEYVIREARDRGTLHGHIELSFQAAEGFGRIVGRSSEVEIDLIRNSRHGLQHELHRMRLATALADTLGITFEERRNAERGLVINALQPESTTAQAGLAVGDRIMECDGVHLLSLSDFIARPNHNEVALRVRREGEAAPFEVWLPIQAQTAEIAPAQLRATQAGFFWFVALLLFIAPSAALLDLAAHALRGQRASRSRGLRTRLRTSMPWFIAFVTCVGIELLIRDRASRLPLELVASAAIAIRFGCVWLASVNENIRQRSISLGMGVVSAALFVVTFLTIAALGGSSDVINLSDAQREDILSWNLFRSGIGPIAFACSFLAASLAPRALRDAQSVHAMIARIMDDGALIILAALVSACFIGSLQNGLSWYAIAGQSAIGATGFVVYRRVRQATPSPQTPTRQMFLAALPILAVTVTIGLIAWQPSDALMASMAEVNLGIVCLALLGIAWKYRQKGALRSHLPLHPYL